MSQLGTEPGLIDDESELKVVERGDTWFRLQHNQTGNVCTIIDTFAEMFPMWAGRVLITADTEKWALTAAEVATGLATSVIMSPAEAGIESFVPSDTTPDGRFGVLVQMYNRSRFDLNGQMI